jgi:hypothetical protein
MVPVRKTFETLIVIFWEEVENTLSCKVLQGISVDEWCVDFVVAPILRIKFGNSSMFVLRGYRSL